MSTHAVAERRPARTGAKNRKPERQRTPDVGSKVEVSVHQFDQIATQAPPNELLDAALAEPAQALPHAFALEQRFGQPLDWVQVRSGPLTRDALDVLDAQAATRDTTVFLRDSAAPLEVVAHEVTHALQFRTDPSTASGASTVTEQAAQEAGAGGGDSVIAEQAPQEAEAANWSKRTPLPAMALCAPVRPAEGLALGAIALLRSGPVPVEEPTPKIAPATVPTTEQAPVAPATAGTTDAIATPVTEAPAQATGPTNAGTAGPAVEGEAAAEGEAFALPLVPELTVSPEEVAAREEAMAAAEEALATAGSAGDLLHAYADASPTVKARQAAALSSNLDRAATGETQEWQSAVPQLEANLPGETGPAPEPLRVEAPAAAAVELEPEVVAPAPEPELAEVPDLPPYTANDQLGGAFSRLTEPPPEQLADAIGETLSDVQTSDPTVPRTPGPPPAIPLGGETDPARIAGQEEAGTAQAAGARDQARQAVVEGPGPEQVQPISVQEAYPIEAVETPAPTPLVAPEGPEAYLALNLPPEVQTAFDEQQQAAMQESMATATSKADEVTVARDTARDEAVTTAEDGAAALNRTAKDEQDATVTGARTTIQTERQSAIDAQHTEVLRVEGEVTDRRRLDEGNIDTQVQTEQKAIDDSYTAGERDIADKVAEADGKAQAQREKAERDAEEESWWDRAVSFVKDAFNALVEAIGDIFDAVRKVVNEALDKLKDFALSVIDRVASFIKNAIALYGEFLKFAVDNLIGTFFPELAAELNAAIDEAVATAQAAVDVVADGLKTGISALVEGLRAGINAAINAWEAGISIAVSFVGAALTGDWGMLAKKVLEGVLRLVGVDPETFYAFIGRAQETFEIIVNDPLGFLSNLVSALVGGVQGFADRFGEHLKKGVIGWLTGTLGGAGITLPPAFDLMGVLDLARQILGLTWERIRAKAVKLIGEQNVARLEFIGEYVTTLVNEGWPGLWDKLVADLSGLLDMVFDGIKSFLLERVVMAMIKKIPALFGPAGAIVELVMTAWNLYQFLRDQLSRIVALVQTVVDSIGDIARGLLTGAITKVEEVLGNLVPIALDLLARLLGLGNVGEDVRAIIEKVQTFIDNAIDALITRVTGLFTGKAKGGAAEPTAAEPAAAPDAASQDADTETIDEHLRIAGENHTIRAVIVDGRASILMASDTFLAVLAQLDQLMKNLRVIYTEKGGYFHGTAQGTQLEQDFGAIGDAAVTLLAEVQKEQDPARERVAATRAITQLKAMFNALGLPEAQQPEQVDLPPHRARGATEPQWGRALWSEVNPLTVHSLDQGGPSGVGIPGITVLGGYDEGHLVARSLGGAGSFVNMAPQSITTNRTFTGVRGIEDSVFKALTLTRNVPEAAPGYIFSYRTTCAYNSPGGLGSELTSRIGVSAGVEQRLFDLAERGTAFDTADVIAELRLPSPLPPGADEALALNVRRRLAWFFLPTQFTIAVEILQEPERKDYQQPVAASQTVANHMGSDVNWR